ncbi:MAG: methanol--corrinoid methyltransferase [Thermoplasmata archaeon]|nr:methanol--corrinoid methyltransferase [Thermoplasmata archaeon]MBE6526296.1 methanol--corrinoid methyltransferase [Thermoplasmata archaeon]
MASIKYKSMAYKCADDIIMGSALHPVSEGFGLKIGSGQVIPEINYAPRAGTEKDVERFRKEYVDYISKDALDRCITAGFPAVHLETEWVSQMNQEKLSAPVVAGQKEICEKYHDEYGLACGVRHTIPDQREADEGLRPGMDKVHSYPEKFFGCCDIACENGCDNLSVESVGGKEFADYAVTQGDIVAFLFGVGYLGSVDMEYIWSEMVDVAKRNRTVAGGDTDCSGANTSMFMAGGMLDMDVQKTFSAITRVIAAPRTLVAWECGAVGPDKDCGYEGIINKCIAGKPTTQEGKNCQCAHCDLMGNLTAQICDCWSNESVEYHPEFGGTSVACWMGSLGYEAALMNTAIQTGNAKTLRDLYALTDLTRSPEAYCLAYFNAYEIGQAIVAEGDSYYLRARAGALKACEIMEKGYNDKILRLSKKQYEVLIDSKKKIEALPTEEDTFVEKCVKEYDGVVKNFNMKNYGF